MSTFQQLRAQAALRFTDPSNAVIADAGPLLRNWSDYVNNAYQEVLRYTPWWPWNEVAEQTVTVLANTRGIALPTDVLAVNSVYDVTNDRPIPDDPGRGSQWRGGKQLRSTTSQIPLWYKMRGSNVELYPTVTVDTQLAVEGLTYPGPMSNNADVPVFPVVYHNIIVDGALALAYIDDGAKDEYNMLWTKFTAAEEKMKNDILVVRYPHEVQITDDFWSR